MPLFSVIGPAFTLLSLMSDASGRQVVRQAVLQEALRDALVKKARALRLRKEPECPGAGTCLYDALALMLVAREQGIYLVPQAGSAYWKHIPDELDDGVGPNSFGYEWEPDSLQTRVLISQGLLPEMHVWLGNPETQEIVDITSGQFPEQGAKLCGYQWLEEPPPDYLWVDASQIPEQATYLPDPLATHVAFEFMKRVLEQWKGRP